MTVVSNYISSSQILTQLQPLLMVEYLLNIQEVTLIQILSGCCNHYSSVKTISRCLLPTLPYHSHISPMINYHHCDYHLKAISLLSHPNSIHLRISIYAILMARMDISYHSIQNIHYQKHMRLFDKNENISLLLDDLVNY